MTTTNTDGFAALGETKGGLPRSVNIPTNISSMLSGTSWADDCFVYQKFAEKLQAYLIGYVNAIYSDHNVYL
jgi:hypothetical protein